MGRRQHDVIFAGSTPTKNWNRKEMAQYALEDLDPSSSRNVRPGDIIVAGKNWGCGSSREQAVICLKEVGVGAIVAAPSPASTSATASTKACRSQPAMP